LKNIWVPLSGQVAQQRKVETIANNIANANTPGFKKDRLTFKEHLTALDKGLEDIDIPREDWSPDDFYKTQGAQNSHVKVDGSYTVHEQGRLDPTNNPLDFALHGKGFFEVSTPQGIRFTRKGNLTVSKDGSLITDSGFKLLSKLENTKSDPSIIDKSDIQQRFIKLPEGARISVSREGEIFNKGEIIGKMSIVEFNDVDAIRKEGNSLYINNDDANLKRDKVATSVNQGFIEGSNVNAVQEMSELIRAHRHFENIQKAISTYDSISGKAVNDIAKF
jgi:flagellar basal-body rod protein FlgG